MTGFFKKISQHTVAAPLKGVQKQRGCYECKLYKSCQTPFMPPHGEGGQQILFIGDFPTHEADAHGVPISGESLEYLESVLYIHGNIDLHDDCWYMNAVNCVPASTSAERPPTPLEIDACRHKWKHAIATLKPKKVILLGKLAIQSVIGARMTDLRELYRWVGWAIPDQQLQTWVFPNYHPTETYEHNNPVMGDLFKQTLDKAIQHSKPFPHETPKVHILTKVNDVLQLLKQVTTKPPQYLAFDYETSGLKPHAPGHFIKTVSICFEKNISYAFPFFKHSTLFLKLWKQVLQGPSRKICQNWVMEAKWSEAICGCTPTYPAMDTMLATHVCDNRKHITGLKFQTYIHFGVMDYGAEIKQYLEANEKGGNAFNTIDNAPLRPLLHYNGLDAIYTYALFFIRTKELTAKNLDAAYDFFHEGMLVCHAASQEGVRIDTTYYTELKQTLERELVELEQKIRQTNAHAKWVLLKNKELDISSPHQIKQLILDVLKVKTNKKTKKGNPAADKEVLEKIQKKHPIIQAILQWRKKDKLLNTYIIGLLREAVDDVIHPNINLHLVVTYRSSVDSPNLQNIPKRDEELKRLIRPGFLAKKGHKLMAVDFKGAEVRSGCIYHNDPQMIEYVVHEKGDMHKEYAAKLYLIDENQVTKPIKNEGKSSFIFPQFYGDWYVANAKALWSIAPERTLENGLDLRTHLKQCGFKTLAQYEHHVQEIERQFWEETFPTFTAWKDIAWENYLENGFIEMYSGFRCTGILNRKNVVNYPFQGTAFHWLLWSMIEVHYQLIEQGLHSKVIMQIHDELIIDLVPSEEKTVYKLVEKIMTKDIREYWTWINIPLAIDATVSAIDGNWYEMTEIKY